MKVCLQNALFMNIHSSFLLKRQILEVIEISINRKMDKQVIVYPYKEFYSAIKKRTTDTINKMDESQKKMLSQKIQLQLYTAYFHLYDIQE